MSEKISKSSQTERWMRSEHPSYWTAPKGEKDKDEKKDDTEDKGFRSLKQRFEDFEKQDTT